MATSITIATDICSNRHLPWQLTFTRKIHIKTNLKKLTAKVIAEEQNLGFFSTMSTQHVPLRKDEDNCHGISLGVLTVCWYTSLWLCCFALNVVTILPWQPTLPWLHTCVRVSGMCEVWSWSPYCHLLHVPSVAVGV